MSSNSSQHRLRIDKPFLHNREPSTVFVKWWGTDQEILSIEVSSLMEDPEAATVKGIARQAYSTLSIPGTAAAESSVVEEPRVSWVVPFPVSVKMRLFCLPYAGGISENVFAKCVIPA